MKFLLFVAGLIACTLATPVPDAPADVPEIQERNRPVYGTTQPPPTKPPTKKPPPAILNYYNEWLPDGSYRYGYVSEDGTSQDVILTPIPGEEGGTSYIHQGRYSYYDSLGHLQEVKYIADQNGYRLL